MASAAAEAAEASLKAGAGAFASCAAAGDGTSTRGSGTGASPAADEVEGMAGDSAGGTAAGGLDSVANEAGEGSIEARGFASDSVDAGAETSPGP